MSQSQGALLESRTDMGDLKALKNLFGRLVRSYDSD